MNEKSHTIAMSKCRSLRKSDREKFKKITTGSDIVRVKNIKIQLHNKVNGILRIGESKHEAKKEYRQYCEDNGKSWNPAYAPGIFSTDTADAYRQTINEFSSWLKDSRPDVWGSKDLERIDKDVAYEYLSFRQEQDCSAWTTSKDMAALNKVLELGLNKKEGKLKFRRKKDVTRSRTKKAHDSKVNLKNYKGQVLISSAFGCRRESIKGGHYQIKDISIFEKDNRLYVSLIEKGGRYRESPCLKSLEDDVRVFLNSQGVEIASRDCMDKNGFLSFYRSSENYLFDRYPNRIDNHSFRHKYAKEYYKELSKGRVLNANYKGFDKELLERVSKALGHNRIEVTMIYLKD